MAGDAPDVRAERCARLCKGELTDCRKTVCRQYRGKRKQRCLRECRKPIKLACKRGLGCAATPATTATTAIDAPITTTTQPPQGCQAYEDACVAERFPPTLEAEEGECCVVTDCFGFWPRDNVGVSLAPGRELTVYCGNVAIASRKRQASGGAVTFLVDDVDGVEFFPPRFERPAWVSVSGAITIPKVCAVGGRILASAQLRIHRGDGSNCTITMNVSAIRDRPGSSD